MANKNNKDVENYTKPMPRMPLGNARYSADAVSRATRDRGNIHAGITTRAGRGDAAKDPGSPNGQAYYDRPSGYAADAAYAKSWIAKGEKASQSARMTAKETALRMMRNKGKKKVDMYEPNKADVKDMNAKNKRYN